MLLELRRRMEEHSEKFSKEIKNTRKTQSELNNTIHEIKNTLEGTNSRLDDTEEWVSNLEDRIV